jgi:alkylhydroperoxidase family enzyme
MTMFPIHTLQTAPDAARATLETVQSAMGGVPNLAAAMAGAPTLVRGFFTLRQIYSEGSLSGAEVQVLSLANAVENRSEWPVAFHSKMAGAAGVSEADVRALRAGSTPAEPRFAALAALTREVIRTKGHVPDAALERFKAAGFEPAQALEVVLGVGFSVLANYAAGIIKPPLDEFLAADAWSAPREKVSR